MENQKNGEKKTWEKPKLIALVKARPEESVLGACKNAAIIGGANRLVACQVGGNCFQLGS